jgi:hypothetical protein
MNTMVSTCWRGPPGCGKRAAVQLGLEKWASSMGQLYVCKTQFWNAPIQGGEVMADDAVEESDEKALLPMEISIIHWGFDISRMSLQDKQYMRTILQKWGRGSQVLSQGHVQRCLVFYHAHLLSSESIILLQAFLEENYKDTVVWLTSEHPLPTRIADWCLDISIPSSGVDISLSKIQQTAPENSSMTTVPQLDDEIQHICKKWMTSEPKLSDVKKIRSIVYALLHRNIRWTDGFHHWLFAIDKMNLPLELRKAVGDVVIKQPFTGSGQTVPSYRIPVLWENYLCSLRQALAPKAVTTEVKAVPVKKERKAKKGKDASSPIVI